MCGWNGYYCARRTVQNFQNAKWRTTRESFLEKMFSPLLCSCVSVQVQARETKGKEGKKTRREEERTVVHKWTFQKIKWKIRTPRHYRPIKSHSLTIHAFRVYSSRSVVIFIWREKQTTIDREIALQLQRFFYEFLFCFIWYIYVRFEHIWENVNVRLTSILLKII